MVGDTSQNLLNAVTFLGGNLVTHPNVVPDLIFVFSEASSAPTNALAFLKMQLQALCWLRFLELKLFALDDAN